MVIQRQNGRTRIGFPAEAMDTKTQIETIARIAMGVETADVQHLLDTYNRVDTLGPIFDPTAYRDVLGTKRGHEELAVAFLAFRRAIDRIVTGDEGGRR